MSDVTMPNNAEDWATFLVDKPLPSPFKVGQAVLRRMQAEKLPYVEIAKRINKDPILALSILSYANKNRASGTESSKTLAHSISMVGLEQLKSIIKAQPFKALSLADIQSFYYLRNLVTSLYAAHLARAISSRKTKGNSEDIYWSSLFAGIPVWYLWRFATPEMRLVRYAIRSNFKLPKVAEKEILGDTMEEVMQAIAKKLTLPELAQSCYEEDKQLTKKQWVTIARSVPDQGKPNRIDDRDITIKMQSPQFVVMVANLVAHFSATCWYSRATLRTQKILAAYLQCPLDEAIKLTHESAAQMSRSHPMPGLMLPAAKLFIPPRKRTKAHEEHPIMNDQKIRTNKPSVTPPQTNQSEKGAGNSPASSKETQLQNDRSKQDKPGINPIYSELLDIMQNRPEEFVDLHELMNAATQGLAYGIELKRASVGLINKDGSRFKNYYSVGCGEQDELANFESHIVPNTIFHKLTARPASIWVKPGSDKKVLQLIPMNFTQVINTQEYFLMSVFVGKKPVAIFYADNNLGKPLTADHYQLFKQMCGAVGAALLHQAKKKK